MTTSQQKTLLYIADPMCSWCWGFSPVMEAIQEQYGDRINLELLVGGLRPGNTERFDTHRRETILGHWRAVSQRTAQPFNFEFQMGEDFSYNTEPASRALVAVRTMNPSLAFTYMKEIQRAFYVENLDVTKEAVLTKLALAQGIDQNTFQQSFNTSELKQKVWDEFGRCRQLGVSGFPSLLAMDGETPTPLSHGYLPIEELTSKVDAWLTI